MATIEEALKKLERSRFRSSFHLSADELDYYHTKGDETIRHHAQDFVRQRLAPAVIPNDGRQTPMRGHPVFKAQHATACCCRQCLYKWYRVPVGRPLSETQQERIVNLLMVWIRKEAAQSSQ